MAGRTVNLAKFLRARLDEDEQTARAVRVPPDWHQGPGDDPEWTDAEMVCMWPPEFHTPYERDKHWRGLTVEGVELAAYIARHDPARVLREVEAKRALLVVHRPVRRTDFITPDGSPAGPLTVCHECDANTTDADWPDTPCWTLRYLAAPYADHPDYQEEWRP